jgi:amidase
VLADRGDCVEACTAEAAAALTVGVVEQWLTGHDATDAIFERAVAALTTSVRGVRRSEAPPNDYQVHQDQTVVLLGELLDDMDSYLSTRSGTGVRSLAEVIAFNEAHAAAELAAFGQEYFEQAAQLGGRASRAYQEARARNVAFARDSCLEPALAAGIDVLVAPAYQPAWKSDLVHGDQVAGGGAVCTPAAILGWPTLTVPMGIVEGLPVGLSIVGRAGSEPLLLAVGQALETSLGLVASGALAPAWRLPIRG